MDKTEENEQGTTTEGGKPRVMVGPHQLGGIEVIARSPTGEQVSTRIDISEATMLVAHLQALLTMWFQQVYMQAAQNVPANNIHLPGQ